MIDTHAHLDFENFDEDREEVITRFFSQGPADAKAMAGKGKAIINVGVDLETSRKSIALAEKHEKIFAAVGFHPEYFTKNLPEMLRISKQAGVTYNTKQNWVGELRELAKSDKVVAIGEAGLDYYRITHNSQRETQKEGFIPQIEIAKELGLPVIVHCREAWNDLYEIVSKFSKAGFSLRLIGGFLKAKLYKLRSALLFGR